MLMECPWPIRGWRQKHNGYSDPSSLIHSPYIEFRPPLG